MKIEKLFSVKGKVAVVSGGSRGIGEMITSAYLANGAKVYITARKTEACNAKAKELSDKYNAQCLSIPSDLSSLEGIEKFVSEIESCEEKIDILVNNAGAAWAEPLDNFTERGWDKVMNLNVKSVFFSTQKFLPLLKKAATKENPSRVINIGSIDGILGNPHIPSYSMCKGGLISLTHVMADEFSKYDIRVNCIARAMIVDKGDAVHANYAPLVEQTPSKRPAYPEEVAQAVSFIASDAASYINGITLPVDGGRIGITPGTKL